MTELSAIPAAEYRRKYALTSFVETGCYRGAGLAEAKRIGFDETMLSSCDLNEAAVSECLFKFPRAGIITDDSLSFLRAVLPSMDAPTLFWLDAHFPEKHGGRDTPATKMPMLEELALIRKLKPNLRRDVIVCDDIHTLADPANPTYRHEKIPADTAAYYYMQCRWENFAGALADTHDLVVLDSERGGVGVFLPRLRVVTVETVQGIGDAIWVYQKLAPHYDLINLVVLGTVDEPVQRRAEPFLRLLAKVGTVEFRVVPGHEYEAAARLRPNLPLLGDTVAYAVNNWLESGVRLDEIDGALPVQWGADFQVSAERAAPEGYCVSFISGSSRHFHDKFTPQQWAQLLAGLDVPQPLVLVGAEYDRWIVNEVAQALAALGVSTQTAIDYPADFIVRLLRDARLMVGFQSGLNVIANSYGVPVIMIDFNHLRAMAQSWRRPDTWFRAYCFEDGVEHILADIKNTGGLP